MDKKILQTPIHAEELEDLKIGDIIYLDGMLVTSRDAIHRRVVEEGLRLPVDITEGAILHAGPIIRNKEDGTYEMVSIGPTTSMRMEKFEKEFIKKTKVRLIIGKGGMGPGTAAGCREYGAVHAVYPAGCAVLAATQVEEVVDVKWTELGMPESLWICRVHEFGPLIITIDTDGNNLFEKNKKLFNARKEAVLEKIYSKVNYMR